MPIFCHDVDSRPSTHSAMFEFGHLTHTGLRRDHNEDTYHGEAALGLFLVADGIGGHDYGEVASALARDVIVREVRDGHGLVDAFRTAGEEILRASRRRADTLPMGTTVVAALVKKGRYEIAWIGDSRAYLWRPGKPAVQITQDHSHVEELVAHGMLSREEARSHPKRKMVTQALGVTDLTQLNIESISGDFEPGAQLLLCSDGLTEHVTDEVISSVLANTKATAQEAVDTLVAGALDDGGTDNVTVLVIRHS